MAPFTWVSNCFNLILLRAGWTRILSEQVSADENRKFFCVLSCPMVSWPPVFTLACPNSAPRCLKKMATAKRFTWKKIPVALSSAPSVDMNLQSNTMPGTGKHTNLMGGGSLCKEPVLTLHWPTKNAVNRRISMLKLHIFDCITISYMIWNK